MPRKSNPYSQKKGQEEINSLASGLKEHPDDVALKAVPFKMVMLGDVSVGKTCIFKRYFYNHYGVEATTLSACLESKILIVNPDNVGRTKVKL